MKKTKLALLHSIIALLLCVSMLVGTTFAWFTDAVHSGKNQIIAGNLDIELEYLVNGQWKPVRENTNVFDENALWEPGHTEVVYLRISNLGSLALKYQLGVNIAEETIGINVNDQPFKLSQYIEFGAIEGVQTAYPNRDAARKAVTAGTKIAEGYAKVSTMEAGDDADYVALVVYMPESVGNEANYKTGTTPPQITLGITLLASQQTSENDSFGPDYDNDATFPVLKPGSVTVDITGKVANGTLTEDVTMTNAEGNLSAVVPAGTKVTGNSLILSVSELSATGSNVTLKENEILRPLDVHIQGVAADNTVPAVITVKEAMMKGLNIGNYALYHVEGSATNEMTAGDLSAHNGFTYDPVTGDVVLAMATFSEVAMTANTENAWNGTVATAFAGGTGTEADPYIIANADQLAYLGDRVSNDNENYGSKHYKLIADVNIGGSENYNTNGRKVLFYPIGYNKVGGTTTDKGNWYTYGGAFSGTFDGTGHTITGIYQNTWAMVGDYSGTYYNDAMGLFGYVNGGTVKNLTIDNFYSEGEFAPTGCVTAYAAGKATFQNIAITNSHPQTYNTGVAGIIGWDNGGDTEAEASNFTFKNITVDDSNTISALWGSWDVAAAGILGYLGEYSKASFEYCNVAATIDVYNDVCGNYQYYWYRYCGAFIGTVDKRLDNGKGALDLSNVTAKYCTVNFGNRHEYYYCEFEKNTVASYTEDFQFSRVDHSDLNMDANPVTCKHTHTANEDKQAVYIPFRQLFGGYGWGVDGVDLDEYDNIEISDITNAQEKFATKFTGDFLYRVGNKNTVSLGSLFAEIDSDKYPVIDSGVYVTIDKVYENSNVSGAFTANSDWTKGTIQFSGTGVVKVTIQDYNFCTPTVLYLEVVDAVNATTATSAKNNNVVLLNDCGFSSLDVSGGYTLFGNGFTMTCGSDSAALDMGYSFVTLNNGTLDNVQIVCPNFDYAVLYKSNMTESGNRKETTDKTRYFNVKSGVMVSGNSQILNSRISGGRAAVNVSGGNCVIDNSRIELGAVASVLVGAANSLTLRDVTLVQKPTTSTYDSNKKLMGFSVLVMCTSGGSAAPITLEGTLVQNAWVDENDKQYVPADAQTIIDTVMSKEEYLHDINGDGTNESLNLGIAYMPADGESTVNTPSITDNRSDKSTIPYASVEVKYTLVTTYVYSYKNTKGTDDSFKIVADYVPNKYSDIITVTYSDTTDGLVVGKSFGIDGWVYELNVDLDKLSGYKLDFSKLSMSVNGVAVTDFKVNGNAKPTSPVAVTAGGTTYTLTATVDGKEYTATFKVTGTETSKDSPQWSSDANGTALSTTMNATWEVGLCVASSKGGTWSGAAPALQGVYVRYWSVAEGQYKIIHLADCTPTSTGKLNGTNTTWTYTPDNGDFTLTLTGGQVHSSNNVYAMPVCVSGDSSTNTLYFVASSSSGLVNSGNGARSIPVTYSFKDNNGGAELTGSHSWSVAEDQDAEYSYSDFCNGTLTKLEGSSGPCVTPDTLITLADGTQVRVDSLTGNEELLVWNMETGKLDKAPIMFVDSDPESEYEIIHLYFSDGTDVKVISEHGFWDYDLNKYVYLDKDAEKYIGHTFAKQNGDSLEKVQLVDVVIENEVTTAWSPVTEGHLCYFVNGMLSMPGGVGGLFNIFDVDAETMTYDYEAMAKDIETYGLFTYEELNAICPLSEEMFNAAGGAYLKISIGKGNLTMDELIAMITRYSKYFE